MNIGFNKPYLTGKETLYIEEAVASERISGDGMFTKKCHAFFQERYGFKKALLTTSCTDALEMAAILADIHEGDEVIAPSYTFVSTVNAFVLRGARIVFADSRADSPHIDVGSIRSLITKRTKVIVPVHYGGVPCDMDDVLTLAREHGLIVVEDAAQAIDSYYKGKPAGSIGHLSAFSFHETKNVTSGEGGMLVINDERFITRAEIIREKGTNRSAFFRGEVDKYNWVDIGSSYLPSDIIAAFLYAQLENLDNIQKQRLHLWSLYHNGLKPLEDAGKIKRPFIPDYATCNAHNYFLVTRNLDERSRMISFLKERGIEAVFHYLSLHKSPFFQSTKPRPVALPNAERFSDCLLRLPFYYELKDEQVMEICKVISSFYK